MKYDKKYDFPVNDLPEVEKIKEENCYLNNPKLKLPNLDIPISKEQYEEIKKVYTDPLYFAKNYMRVASNFAGVCLLNLFPYQEEFLTNLYKYRFNIAMMARQMGKCVEKKTKITVRNKLTGIIEEIEIKNFYSRIKHEKT